VLKWTVLNLVNAHINISQLNHNKLVCHNEPFRNNLKMTVSKERIDSQLALLDLYFKASNLMSEGEELVCQFPSRQNGNKAAIWRTNVEMIENGKMIISSGRFELPIGNGYFGKSKSEMSLIIDGMLQTLKVFIQTKDIMFSISTGYIAMIMDLPIDRLEIMKQLVQDGMEIREAFEAALRL